MAGLRAVVESQRDHAWRRQGRDFALKPARAFEFLGRGIEAFLQAPQMRAPRLFRMFGRAMRGDGDERGARRGIGYNDRRRGCGRRHDARFTRGRPCVGLGLRRTHRHRGQERSARPSMQTARPYGGAPLRLAWFE